MHTLNLSFMCKSIQPIAFTSSYKDQTLKMATAGVQQHGDNHEIPTHLVVHK
jgi:hypothetical protein